MTRGLLDTGFLYAVFDADDQHHAAAVTVLESFTGELVLPTAVLVELAYLLFARLGHEKMRLIMSQMMHQSLHLVPLTNIDLIRVNDLLNTYADVQLDFVDAVIVTLAERFQVNTILTVDRRDFLIIRPNHYKFFELLP